MKRALITFMFCICASLGIAQVKIGDNPQSINPTSLLELESKSKVLVINRMSEVEILNLKPLPGAVVYNTDANCIFYYDGVNWNNLCHGGSTESISWGAITGNLTNQADLSAELDNYVDLGTAQSIAGEKTFTEKFTVNTGTTTNQVAEFLGRVKGEAGTAPEDFVTKAQLDASDDRVGADAGAWGSITGNLADQTDLTGEFQKYVNLTQDQSIAGEKTLNNKLTVDTGDTAEQVAEFLGRVKGENALEKEDFVTKKQLDAVELTGASGIKGSIFFAGEDTGITEKNGQLFWDNTINQLRIGGNAPIGATTNSVLNVQGSISKPIAFNTNGLDRTHHTIIITRREGAPITMFLPEASTCIGRIYIIKKRPGIDLLIHRKYYNTDSELTEVVDDNVLHLQSNGSRWEQIN